MRIRRSQAKHASSPLARKAIQCLLLQVMSAVPAGIAREMDAMRLRLPPGCPFYERRELDRTD